MRNGPGWLDTIASLTVAGTVKLPGSCVHASCDLRPLGRKFAVGSCARFDAVSAVRAKFGVDESQMNPRSRYWPADTARFGSPSDSHEFADPSADELPCHSRVLVPAVA